MASEKAILRALNILTGAPQAKAEVESLSSSGTDHLNRLRRIVKSKNVIGVGISEKISKKEGRTGKLALTFYVEKKIPLTKLRGDKVLPPTLPEALSGEEAITTDVIVLGKLRPEVNKTRTSIQPGNSIGHVDITAGTLGAIATKGGKFFLLSNSHVLANAGLGKIGDEIIYPGDADGGAAPDDLVGKLVKFGKFKTGGAFVNRVDCAIASILASRLATVTSEIKGLGIPKGTIAPKRGMKVVKVGRTTNKTTGEIRDINFRFTVDYEDVGEVGFLDQVLCTRYTKPGDSGSLVIDQATGKAVGLHFAGGDGGPGSVFGLKGGSVCNPIGDVLKELGVELVTKPIKQPEKAAPKSPAKKKKKTAPGKKK